MQMIFFANKLIILTAYFIQLLESIQQTCSKWEECRILTVKCSNSFYYG